MRKALLAALVGVALFGSGAAEAAGNPANGKTIFGRCAICHTVTKGGPNSLGPNLFGVVGRKAASLPTFMYSGVLKSSGITWTPDKLKQWVMGPQKMVPGTKMSFAGLSSAGQADDVVAYLATLK